MRLLGWGLDLLFPPRCPACMGRTRHPAFCAACEARIGILTSPLCPRCGVGFPGAGGDHPCVRCLRGRPQFNRARACAEYDQAPEATGPLIEALHRYKYARDVSLAAILGAFLAERCPLTVDHDLLVPVPLHRDRLRWRGFNQALLLAKPLARRSHRPLDPFVLERRRATPPQVGLGEVDRRRNIAGAFAVRNRAAVAGRSVLLIDDVMTTGATANECARTLRRAGARRVDVLVLARAA